MKIRKLIGVVVFGFIAANVVLAERPSSSVATIELKGVCNGFGCVNG